jgi:hypothetical protein
VRSLNGKIKPVALPAVFAGRKERILVAHIERASDRVEKNQDDLKAWRQFRASDGGSVCITIRGKTESVDAIKRMFRHFDGSQKRSYTTGLITALLSIGDVVAEGLEERA